MNVALLFFLLLVPLSGFIAWAGDRIGHKSGKKRHTLFGLRPRHTATLITIAAGMCISVVSFGMMWALSDTFREVMARGSELLQENKRLSQDNQVALMQVARNRTEVERLDTEVENYRDQVRRAEAAKQQAEADFQRAKTSLASAKKAMQTANSNLLATKNKLGVTQTALMSAETRVTDARSQVARANADFRRAEARTQEARTVARKAEAQVKLAQARTREIQQKLGNAESTFNEATQFQKAALEKQNKQLASQSAQMEKQTAQIDEQRSELERLTVEKTQRLRDVEVAKRDIELARTAIEKFRTTTTALRGRQITYKVGEEVDRVSIPAGISIWRIEAILDSLLTSSAKKAEAKGAKRITEKSRAVALLPQAAMVSMAPTFAPSKNGSAGPLEPIPVQSPGTAGFGQDTQPVLPSISETDLLRAAADAIRRANKDVVVVVVTAANAVAGETVAVDIRTYLNPVVLNSGTTVGEITVDGSASRQEIIDALYGFLRRDVRSRLLKAGVIPPLVSSEGPEAPTSRTVSDTEAGNIFTLSGDAWLKIMDDIRRAGSQARVIVRVDKTTHAADPVSLRFDVKKGRDSRPVPRSDEDRPSGKSLPVGAPSGMALW
ncbi:MAG: DUF3084 domain-containing protein [Armatimonadota bacterium]